MRTLFFTGFLAMTLFASGQNLEREKIVYSFQAGTLGTWMNAEINFGKSFALRTEAGLDFSLFGGDFYNRKYGYFFAPVLNVEPRYYYNLNKRAAAGKVVKGNSGNFFTLKVGYHPDWFVLSENGRINVIEQITFIPKWGIRRHIGTSNFNYEAGFGIGVRRYFLKQYDISGDETETAVDLHLRIGYTF